MHWIVQDNLHEPDEANALVSTLAHLSIPFTTTSMLPGTGTLSPDPKPSGPTMVWGSVGLVRVARERGWQPGSFLNANHGYQACVAHWGRGMLNADARFSAFKDVEPVGDSVFIRPVEDSKYFTCRVMDADEVTAWRDAVRRGERSPVRCSPLMDGNTRVLCGPPATIHRECRFFVVDGAVVAWSTYQQDGKARTDADVDPVSMGYARACVQTWQPARAFVLDTALTPGGPRIVEVNCINSAGLYDADVRRIVVAIEGMAPWAGR